MEELRKHIETIIKNTFEKIDAVYETNQEKDTNKVPTTESRLIFPKYRGKEETRVSEQELRFLFIEEFNKYCNRKNLNYFYSIETPTEESYSFGATPKKHCVSNDGQSAQFDMVIFNKNKERVCLIEFKNNNNDAGEHEKDFLKLSVEGKDRLCYFISIAEASNSGTLGEKEDAKTGIIPKFGRFAENNEICYDNITYICHCINNRGKGFDTIYDGIVKNEFGWKEKKIFKR